MNSLMRDDMRVESFGVQIDVILFNNVQAVLNDHCIFDEGF